MRAQDSCLKNDDANSPGNALTPYFPLGWLIAQTYAETAATSESVRGAPPRGGIGTEKFFGLGTPSLIVRVIRSRLPSLCSHLPSMSDGACGDPLASDP